MCPRHRAPMMRRWCRGGTPGCPQTRSPKFHAPPPPTPPRGPRAGQAARAAPWHAARRRVGRPEQLARAPAPPVRPRMFAPMPNRGPVELRSRHRSLPRVSRRGSGPIPNNAPARTSRSGSLLTMMVGSTVSLGQRHSQPGGPNQSSIDRAPADAPGGAYASPPSLLFSSSSSVPGAGTSCGTATTT